MSDVNKLTWGLSNRGLPAPIAGDNIYGPARVSRYGELVTQPLAGSKLYTLADEGSYFTALNPTPGTGIVGAAAPVAFADTGALIFLRNSQSSGQRVYLDYIELMVTAAGTNGTSWNFVMRGDKGNSRYTSGGTQLTPVNTNMGSSRTPGLDRLQFGANVLTAATSEVRTIHQGVARTVLKVIGDKYLFTFGNSSPAPMSGIPLEGTTQASIQIPCPPIVLDPGDTFALHEWAPAQTVAAAYEVAIGLWVR